MIRFGHVSCMNLGYHVAYDDKVYLLLCSIESTIGGRVGSPLKKACLSICGVVTCCLLLLILQLKVRL